MTPQEFDFGNVHGRVWAALDCLDFDIDDNEVFTPNERVAVENAIELLNSVQMSMSGRAFTGSGSVEP